MGPRRSPYKNGGPGMPKPKQRKKDNNFLVAQHKAHNNCVSLSSSPLDVAPWENASGRELSLQTGICILRIIFSTERSLNQSLRSKFHKSLHSVHWELSNFMARKFSENLCQMIFIWGLPSMDIKSMFDCFFVQWFHVTSVTKHGNKFQEWGLILWAGCN